jgi:hypothetical protein
MKFFCIGILQQPTGKISKFPEEFATSFSNLQSYVRKIPNELGSQKRNAVTVRALFLYLHN